MARSVNAMMQSWEAELLKDTGKSLDAWLALTRKKGPASEKERKGWLVREHGLHKDWAWLIASTASGQADYRDDAALLDQMFEGKKAALRPLYDKVAAAARALGKDVSFTYCRTQVSVRRRHNIAVIKPAALTRIDLGLALGRTKAPARLIDTGGLQKGDRVTHRIPISAPSQVDAEVRKWLRTAYDLDA